MPVLVGLKLINLKPSQITDTSEFIYVLLYNLYKKI